MTIGLCGTFVYRNSSISLSSSSPSPSTNPSNITDAEWIINSITLIIFILAFLGNTAALIVMFGKRGSIRLTNNKYLANLACADLLRACSMPFTIIARMKRNFIFGRMICKILPIVQGLVVAVDVFTLVCISIERYLAICRPLLILKLQSVRFANLLTGIILLFIWLLGLLIALPNVYMYNLCSLPTPGRFKCEKTSPKIFDERIYMVTLDAFYFIIPMVVMIVLYTLIIWKMYRNNTARRMIMLQSKGSISSKTRSNSLCSSLISCNNCFQYRSSKSKTKIEKFHSESLWQKRSIRLKSITSGNDDDEDQTHKQQSDILLNKQQTNRIPTISSHALQDNITKKESQRLSSQNSSNKSCNSLSSGISRLDRHRRKALKLLITLIVEFFVCWTPLFIYHTIGTFNKTFYRSTPKFYVDLILLFSFASASCNPLTYYFMSKRYRTVLYSYLPYCCLSKNQRMSMRQKSQQTPHFIRGLNSSYHQNSIDKNQIEQLQMNIYQHS
ncbi:unnamed protein product [Adineta steineri]|uniref:G-protein coupled receptors family 1 profile domain-containing protein n=1 Tax=Adineta steineri TaxID=433720 RepID=A0A814NK16_9BILA|nr:unnamed protein product [Adineta steineri]